MGKSGIPYFPLECELDSKFELIEAEFGLDGFGVVVKLFQKIYGGKGYYAPWTSEVALVFARRIGLGASAVSEIVNAAVKRGVFDKNLFEKFGILTSKGIQQRYFEAVSRRKQIEVKRAYLLVEVTQICKNVDISAENVDKNGENASIFLQRKEKKRKEKERKGERSMAAKPPPPPRRPSRQEIRDFCRENGIHIDPDAMFDYYEANGWVQSNGNPIQDWRACVRVWERREKERKDREVRQQIQNKTNPMMERDYTLEELCKKIPDSISEFEKEEA